MADVIGITETIQRRAAAIFASYLGAIMMDHLIMVEVTVVIH
jgi:hypothetical protein